MDAGCPSQGRGIGGRARAGAERWAVGGARGVMGQSPPAHRAGLGHLLSSVQLGLGLGLVLSLEALVTH